ncbi:hypothetical protein D9O40_00840 [Clostridium autoethanogenum]|uniref:Uncharacterized protein n=1 Tax=Clostridium autoethanogenum TaxID=84023 RepID=A0A3M0T2S4_9CLOT|nr:hypothetical protein [Clostridium autoethanogenum]RMD04927.1 hypothetical protein D9O40_00840 [Clostridium autoethanogenum]
MGKGVNELKKAIIENPDLPIRFFAAEECNCGDYPYEECNITKIEIDEVALYDGMYYNKEDLGEKLYADLSDEYKTEEELNKHVDMILENEKFEGTISVFID